MSEKDISSMKKVIAIGQPDFALRDLQSYWVLVHARGGELERLLQSDNRRSFLAQYIGTKWSQLPVMQESGLRVLTSFR